MAKKPYIAPHYTSQELKQKYRNSQDQVETKRWHLLWKISLGWSIKNSAIAVGINYDYGKEILKRYNEQGSEGVKNQRKKRKNKGGKKPLLNDLQLEKLTIALESKPSDGGIWTGAKVASWIPQETGVEKVWNQRGWDYLKKCNYSWQRPRPKHNKGNELEQEEFKKNLPLRVKNLEEIHPEFKIEVWFFDEHRVGLKPILRKVWSKKGTRPIALVNHRYEWLYVYGFVNPKTGETLWYLIPRVNTKWLNKVYEQFAIDVGISENKKVLLIEDNAGWHSSHKVKKPQGIIVDYLPPYSPELQPAERLWNLVDEPLVNEHFDTIEQIEEILTIRCNILREEMKEQIKSLTNYHWFTYA
jgi:transposase